MIDIILIACKYNSWAVNVFVHLFEKFCSENIIIVSENNYLTISKKHKFIQLPNDLVIDGDCPKNKFSDSLIFALKNTPSKYAIVMLADYWLYDILNMNDFVDIKNYLDNNSNVLRVDVGSQYRTNGVINVMPEIMPHLFECEGSRNCFHPVSLCPAIWNKEKYLSILLNDLDPWATESICLDKYLGKDNNDFIHLRSLWLFPGPLKYFNAMRGRDDKALVIRREIENEIKHLIPSRFTYGFEN